LEEAKNGFREGDIKHVISAAHRMKSSASTLGLTQLAILAGSLEAAATKGLEDRVETLMGELAHGVPDAIAALQTAWDDVHRQNVVSKQFQADHLI
jgi:HPt (histidine-containing phosphotransfer) domain-containing protein